MDGLDDLERDDDSSFSSCCFVFFSTFALARTGFDDLGGDADLVDPPSLLSSRSCVFDAAGLLLLLLLADGFSPAFVRDTASRESILEREPRATA